MIGGQSWAVCCWLNVKMLDYIHCWNENKFEKWYSLKWCSQFRRVVDWPNRLKNVYPLTVGVFFQDWPLPCSTAVQTFLAELLLPSTKRGTLSRYQGIFLKHLVCSAVVAVIVHVTYLFISSNKHEMQDICVMKHFWVENLMPSSVPWTEAGVSLLVS